MASYQSSSSEGSEDQASNRFTSELSTSVPGVGYSQQKLPEGVASGPSPDKIASAIHLFRYLFQRCDHNFLRRNLMSNNQKKELAKFNLLYYFRSKEDIESFLKSYPQYFAFTNETIYNPYYFSDDGLIELLKQHRIPSEPRTAVPYELIASVSECKRHVARLRDRALRNPPLVLAMDCEGVNLGRYGPLTLLQLGTAEGEVFIFDILATPNKEDMFIKGGLKGLIEDGNILKVIHDCRTDQTALAFQFHVTLTNVFDTSTAFMTLCDQFNILRRPYRPKLVELFSVFGYDAKQKKSLFSYEQPFGKRPLTSEMLEYAADDVLGLVPLIYENMNRLISPLWRPFFEAEVNRSLRESRLRDLHETYKEDRKKSGYN
ncbi:piRNA biogenesis protein EXD1 [Holothuria leucospilota]|uniref:PiRNA biogenesis protein EXD1 n=1 Tax=Holothuria leucospilota TaxID=206669 RepID=A0A9Q1CL77_HOLLE|nr:piRNA biogenesis protein EXD1 [Holothuria leucospilota]